MSNLIICPVCGHTADVTNPLGCIACYEKARKHDLDQHAEYLRNFENHREWSRNAISASHQTERESLAVLQKILAALEYQNAMKSA